MKKWGRRGFVGAGTTLLVGANLPRHISASSRMGDTAARADETRDKHFFIHIVIPDGVSQHNFFDARPLSFTEAGLVENYREGDMREAMEWTPASGGRNGTRPHWVSPQVRPLEKYKDLFSILNGVHMSRSFDGHGQNLNMLMANNPFGGEYFAPYFASPEASLEYIATRLPFAELSNVGRGLEIEPGALSSLAESARGLGSSGSGGGGIKAFVQRRAQAVGQKGNGLFSKGASEFANALGKTGLLSQKLATLDFEVSGQPGMESFQDALNMIAEVFARGVSNTAVLEIRPDDTEEDFFTFDTHAVADAKKQPVMFEQLVAKLERFFEFVSSQTLEINGQEIALKDHLTFLISSEFSRTNRQMNRPIDETGTDHNPFSNSLILGGKGLKNGHVFGESDLDALDGGTFAAVSGAHRQLDRNLLKAVGKPMDLTTGQLLGLNPDTVVAEHYLNVGSVQNTLMDIFGVPADKRVKLPGNQGGEAPSLAFLKS